MSPARLFAAVLSACVLNAAEAKSCSFPSPAANFKQGSDYNGVWYEIGKVQTFNPFEAGCVCTGLTVFEGASGKPSDRTVNNTCKLLSPTGPWLNASARGSPWASIGL